MAHPTSTKPTNISEQYGRLQFNKRLRRSMVRKRFATRRSSEISRREAMKP